MGSEDAKDPLKGVDWKAVGGDMQRNPSVQPTLKKRLPKRVRQIPEYYYLPKWPLPSAILFCSACIAGGVGAGMLVEAWIHKKVKEDGGVIWEFDK
ncbi:uncharacterized protein LOC133287615 [Gastrolobium bilobum]|uniref:uncharacterized protein LOC133287615 n=1 Tax=Gastrolobium bilobum TaxID=150636 RepID=UPI002AB20E99|nr:uncharacterized protein LOC133287615 [Gastrolobium bilobum]